MTDIKTEIKSFAAAEETKAKGFIASHWKGFVAGGLISQLVMLLIHKVL